jgi:hypothetical protein
VSEDYKIYVDAGRPAALNDEAVARAAPEIHSTGGKIELRHAGRWSTVTANERTDKPPPAPAIVRRRGDEPDLVVYRLSVRFITKPQPCVLWVS